MKRHEAGYDTVPFPTLQRQMADWLELGRHRHTTHALIEVDVTDARRAIRAYRARHAAPLSLTAFIIACLAQAIDEHKLLQAYRKGRDQLVLFADVDVTTTVEHVVDGQKIPVPHIIRAANTKSVGMVEREISAARAEAQPQSTARRWLPLWLVLPARIRRLVWSRVLADPHRRKRLTGTVMFTSVGMFGSGTGWGIPASLHTLCLTVGGLATKPGVVGERIEIREYLCLTISVDHDILDGAVAARFSQRLKELIECGSSLREHDRDRSVDPGLSSAMGIAATQAGTGRGQHSGSTAGPDFPRTPAGSAGYLLVVSPRPRSIRWAS